MLKHLYEKTTVSIILKCEFENIKNQLNMLKFTISLIRYFTAEESGSQVF